MPAVTYGNHDMLATMSWERDRREDCDCRHRVDLDEAWLARLRKQGRSVGRSDVSDNDDDASDVTIVIVIYISRCDLDLKSGQASPATTQTDKPPPPSPA